MTLPSPECGVAPRRCYLSLPAPLAGGSGRARRIRAVLVTYLMRPFGAQGAGVKSHLRYH
jgi:hypothetical protein